MLHYKYQCITWYHLKDIDFSFKISLVWGMANYKLILVNLVLLLSCLTSVLATDTTLVSGATGTSVVLACVAKIDNSGRKWLFIKLLSSVNSKTLIYDFIFIKGIFTEDYRFLRYLAYAESTDGTTLDTGAVGGIWKVKSSKYLSISMFNRSKISKNVFYYFIRIYTDCRSPKTISTAYQRGPATSPHSIPRSRLTSLSTGKLWSFQSYRSRCTRQLRWDSISHI